ncbi:hypothetical protein [Marinobacter arenosus]|uniref:hypothetical protein n=1 Tax=Marinobacter arenosus TaxID=2856822 RepID=UPI001C4B6077|nr:hypothetical protein [Marinobacter arenosus]MBW0145876.1 hypothetical protein [Marinobacter arenosus]
MQQQSEEVLELAKELVSSVNSMSSEWRRAYVRFHHNGSNYGVCGSYSEPDKVKLFDPFACGPLFDVMISGFLELHELMLAKGQVFCVALLVVDADLNFKVMFESEDSSKWPINKSEFDGIPSGFDDSSPLTESISEGKPWWKLW